MLLLPEEEDACARAAFAVTSSANASAPTQRPAAMIRFI
jgi:hypothetical protein